MSQETTLWWRATTISFPINVTDCVEYSEFELLMFSVAKILPRVVTFITVSSYHHLPLSPVLLCGSQNSPGKDHYLIISCVCHGWNVSQSNVNTFICNSLYKRKHKLHGPVLVICQRLSSVRLIRPTIKSQELLAAEVGVGVGVSSPSP